MTQHTRRAIIVVPSALRAQANAKAREVDDGGDPFTDGTALSPSGAAPATHYWCSWALTVGQWNSVRSKLDTAPLRASGVRVYDAATTTPAQVLADLNLTPVIE